MGKYNIKVILNDHIKGQVLKRDVVSINQPVLLKQHPFSSNNELRNCLARKWPEICEKEETGSLWRMELA